MHLLRADPAGGVGTHHLEDVLNGDVMAAETARCNRAVVEDEPGDVEPGERHGRAGDGLVAAHQTDQAVEQVPAGHQLDRVRDHLARDERGSHALGAHRHPVRHRDGIELHGRAAGLPDAALDVHRQLALVKVARHRLDPGRRHTDDRLGEVLVGKAGALQQRARRRAIRPVGERGAVALGGVAGDGVRVLRHLILGSVRPTWAEP